MDGIMLQALRIRDFRLLWAGGLISSLGSWLLTLAIPTHIFLVTGSLRATGLTVAAEYLPLLVLGPVAGVFADRWDRRRLLIGTNLFCAGAVAVMLLGTAPGRYWVLYAALVAENAGVVLNTPAWQARTPAIVGTGSLLSSANALNSVSSGTVRLIGGPLGGILLAVWGARWLIGIDAASYLLSAAAMFMTSAPGREPGGREAEGREPTTVATVARDLAAGVRVLRRQPVARALLLVTVIFLAANASLSAVLIPFGIQRLGGSEHTGFLLAGLGIGFLLGAPVIRVLLDRVQPGPLLAATLAATAAAFFALFTSSSLSTALPAAVAVGAFGSMSLVVPQTAMQRVIPNALLGRIGAVFLTGEAAATLAGAAAGPVLAQAAGLTVTAAVASLVTLAAAALARLSVPKTSVPQRHGPVALALSIGWPVPISTVSHGPPTTPTAVPTRTPCRPGKTSATRRRRPGGPLSPRSRVPVNRP
jgi:MFS family permease